MKSTFLIAVIVVLATCLMWPHPKISADAYRICARCPKYFKNNVTWHTFIANVNPTEQMAQYVNDASESYCTLDWKAVFGER